MSPTRERLQQLYEYNPSTGKFVSLSYRGGRRSGETAGHVTAAGYRMIGIDRKHYRAHRLAWLYVHGYMPKGLIDHINGCRHDNRIENLRCVNPDENQHNSWRANANSTTGALGVSRCLRSGKWRAGIVVRGKKIWIGRYDTVEQASLAYLQAKAQRHATAPMFMLCRDAAGPPATY